MGGEVIFSLELTFDSSFDNVNKKVNEIFSELKGNGFTIKNDFKIKFEFAIREVLNNAVEHGNKMDFNKKVNFKLEISSDIVICRVSDEGNGFSLDEVLKKENIEVIKRHRNRGIKTLIDLGFILKTYNGSVVIKIKLNKNDFMYERLVNCMDFINENGIITCIINKDLIAPNVKELVGEIKENLDETMEYNIFIFDLSQVETVDSMGITFLIGSYKDITSQGKKVKLKKTSDSMLELFKIMKLDEVFEIL
ncbi:MAG: STAS domain-containing protein [Clostridiales bacterium]